MPLKTDAAMNGYQLVAALVDSVTSLLGSLAWPTAVVVSILLFREKLGELLPKLHFRFRDAEVDFRLDQAEKDAEALPPPPEDAPETQPTPEEKSRFEQIAAISPRTAILQVRTDIEEAVRALAKAAGLLTPRVQSTLGLTRLLRSKGVIERQTSALLDDLRVIGNSAVHNLNADFSAEDALRYKELADRAISQLRVRQSIVDDDD
jgi:hypothetical protein